ncbi:MAG: sugar transferase [Candidatus Omnitrophica bacterium]|nr:sugar transferase [Candidatus Omnitrophota bacterium]
MVRATFHPFETFFLGAAPLWKRSIDLIGSAVLLILTFPLFLIVAAAIKLASPGPVFFRQERVGLGGRRFVLLKFRTMENGADENIHKDYLVSLIRDSSARDRNHANKPMVKIEDDPRITPFGRFLRKSCIDELPQLINVLRGEMSLVGPRPPIPYEVEKYSLWHSGRFDILPGMTGLWQVSGKNALSFAEMVRLDIAYANLRSLRLDLKILAKTPWAVLCQFFHSN